VDLPTYTNIWRIEKRLYKLYDFRLPAPLPITWIAVFAGITVPYVVFLVAIGLPFNHNVVWLYVLPPGVLTWLTTRPVIESKRLPELVSSQLRYVAEPRTWCRMAPFAEKDDILLIIRVWRRRPSRPPRQRQARPKPARQSPGRLRVQAARRAPASPAAVRERPPSIAQAPPPVPQPSAPALPVHEPRVQVVPVREAPVPDAPVRDAPVPDAPARDAPAREAPAREAPARGAPARDAQVQDAPAREARVTPETEAAGAQVATPSAQARQRAAARPGSRGRQPARGAVRRAARQAPSAGRTPPDPRSLEVSHDAGPGPRGGGVAQAVPPERPSWPSLPAGDAVSPAPVPEPEPFPDAGPFPEFPEAGPFPEPERLPDAGALPERQKPAAPPEAPPHVTPARSVAERVAAKFLDLDREGPLPSVERALSGPGSRGEETWRRRVKVVTGAHDGPGVRDQEALDRGRAKLPLPGPRLIAVLGCTSGAGQTVTAMMTGRMLAAIRDVPVAAVDLNPGRASLSAAVAPVTSATSLLAGAQPRVQAQARGRRAARLDVIAGPDGARALDADGYRQLAGLLAERYPLTLVDTSPSGLTRVLAVADQLVLVVPASPEAATSLASTQQWLTAHGYHELGARAVTVINGVSARTSQDLLEAETVAKGRCRAIVRVPWDDQVSAQLGAPSPSAKTSPLSALRPQTRVAYTALAGVLVAGMAALPVPSVPVRSPGEHSH
jgi:MinD-like ATPase involved in chromosome partitioning or flagellar assembly